MTYPSIHIRNATTGEIVNREMTSEEYEIVYASFADVVQLTADATLIAVGEIATLTLQLLSANHVINGTSPVNKVASVILSINGALSQFETDAFGQAEIELEAVSIQTYEIFAVSHTSNTVIVEVQ